ncbi:MAG: hypothetical protein ABSD43_14710 [Terracidiphilus sp.]|jgi:hypothetical protein
MSKETAVNCGDKSMAAKIELILAEKGYEHPWCPLYDLAKEVGDLHENLDGKILWVKYPGLVLLVLVPILSAFVTGLTGTEWHVGRFSWAGIVSFILTIVTILNSSFRPRDRFRKCCNLEMDLSRLERSFLIDLERLAPGKIDSNDLLAKAESLDESLQPIRDALIDLFLPDMASGGDSRPDQKPEHPLQPKPGRGDGRHLPPAGNGGAAGSEK